MVNETKPERTEGPLVLPIRLGTKDGYNGRTIFDGRGDSLCSTFLPYHQMIQDIRGDKANCKELMRLDYLILACNSKVRLVEVKNKAQALLDFIREKYPDDFREGGKGFSCPHHIALDMAILLARTVGEAGE